MAKPATPFGARVETTDPGCAIEYLLLGAFLYESGQNAKLIFNLERKKRRGGGALIGLRFLKFQSIENAWDNSTV
jgi:hypothetical protein